MSPETAFQPEAYTIAEFCQRYRVGRTYTYHLIKLGQLHVVKAGRRTLVPAEVANAWFDGLTDGRA